MSFVIDTNVLIEIERDNKDILSQLQNLDIIKEDIYIASPTYSEFYLGLLMASKKLLSKEKERLDMYKLLHTTKKSSELLAENKYHVSKKGVMIPIIDLLIASIVLANNMTLVTLDEHFNSIPNLTVILLKCSK